MPDIKRAEDYIQEKNLKWDSHTAKVLRGDEATLRRKAREEYNKGDKLGIPFDLRSYSTNSLRESMSTILRELADRYPAESEDYLILRSGHFLVFRKAHNDM